MIDWNEINDYKKNLKDNEFFELVEARNDMCADKAIRIAISRHGYKNKNVCGVHFQKDKSGEYWKIKFEVRDINKIEITYQAKDWNINVKIKDNKFIIFDDNKEVVFKIVEKGISFPYIYRFLKKQVNVKSTKEFIEHFGESSEKGNLFHNVTKDLLRKLLYKDEIKVMNVLQ